MTALAKLRHFSTGVRFDRAAIKAGATLAIAVALPLLREIADPRGRCNRKAFLHIALAFLGLQFVAAGALWLSGVVIGQVGTLLLNAPVLWIGTTVCVKRLHDVGRRGWWIPGAFAIWFVSAMVIATVISMVCGPEAVDPGQPMFFVVFAAITLPAFGSLLWLHTAPSVAGPNPYGPVPVGMGLSMPTHLARPSTGFVLGSILA